MKTINFFYVKLAVIVLSSFFVEKGDCQLTSGSSSLESMRIEPLKPRKPLTSHEQKSSQVPVKLPTVNSVLEDASYFFPGLVVNRQGSWQGGDNLLNLSANVGVYLTISKPETMTIEVDQRKLKEICADIFEKAGINPRTLVTPGNAPLPFFNIQILIYPIHDGYVASLEGRLFEAVDIKRIELDSNMSFQAVTWQKSTLIVSPANKIQEQIKLSVESIAKSFTESYQAFLRNNPNA